MYFKIAISNIKKSFKDYAIYFITLTLAVCIFYNFNSIENQTAMEYINSVGLLIKAVSYISVFISIIFGALMLYANNALVKKRKKELGIYATLGMAKRKISQIFIYETLIVAAMALLIGLLIGIILSQGLSVLTAQLFDFNMSSYHFILSMAAIYKTLMYFGVMFILVMIFNITVVAKHKLIDLIYASKKNEEIKTKNPIVSFIIFTLSLVALGIAYHSGLKYSLTPRDVRFPQSVMWGGLGTLLFFFGLAGVVLAMAKSSKHIYLKRLNMFIIKQFYHKVNTNALSLGIICLMLFITIGLLTSGLSMKYQAEKMLSNSIPLDAMVSMDVYNRAESQNIEAALKSLNFQYDDFEHVILDDYITDLKVADILMEYADEKMKKSIKSYVGDLEIVKLSQYNRFKKLKGEAILDLKENEMLILTDREDFYVPLENLISENKKINLNGKHYKVKVSQEKAGQSEILAIVEDTAAENLKKVSQTMHIKANKENIENLESKVQEIKLKFKDVDYNREALKDQYGFILYSNTKLQVYNDQKTKIGTVLYMCLYIGFVFLVASTAVLALQQLTEASDSVNQYKALKKIGVSEDMINKSILIQIAIHFILPLTLAIVHAAVALQVINKLQSSLGLLLNVEAVSGMLIITGILIIYGGYGYASYAGYKNIVKNN